MPLIDQAQQLGDATALHREIRLSRRPFNELAVGAGQLLGHEFLVVDIIDNWADVGGLQHGLVGKKEHYRLPERLVLLVALQPRG